MWRPFVWRANAWGSIAAGAALAAVWPDAEIRSVRRRIERLRSGTCPPRLVGSFLPSPTTRRWRILVTLEGEATFHFPLAGSRWHRPRLERAVPGRCIAFDIDREPVGHEVREGWCGEIIDVRSTRGRHVGPRRPAMPLAETPGAFARLSTGLARWTSGEALSAVLGWALVAWLTDRVEVFVLGVSFVHYLVYLATLAAPWEVALPRLLRDALFWKAVSMLVLGAVFVTSARFEPVALGLAALGVGVSCWAAATLGLERTHFAVELGVLEPMPVRAGPYRFFSHPMIAGSLLALLGLQLDEGFRASWSWLAPAHGAFYALHLMQEVWVRRTAAPGARGASEGQPLTSSLSDRASWPHNEGA